MLWLLLLSSAGTAGRGGSCSCGVPGGFGSPLSGACLERACAPPPRNMWQDSANAASEGAAAARRPGTGPSAAAGSPPHPSRRST